MQIAIPRRSNRCIKHQEPFKEGAFYYSLLEEKKGIYLREDYCVDCWAQCPREGKVFWKSLLEPKVIKKDGADEARDQRALILLRELIDSNQSEKWPQIFILALYLARKKKIVFRKEFIDPATQHTIQIYEEQETEQMISIVKMAVTQLDIVTIQKQIAESL